MKITREQINKMNAKMGNGWTVDLHTLFLRGEKSASLTIPQEDGSYIQGKLYIEKSWDWHPGAYNGIRISMNVSRWTPGGTEGVFVSHGLGKWKHYERPDLTRCNFSEVQKMTHQITAADILAIYEENKEKINNDRIA